MSIKYFKPHGRFDFSADTLDIGNPITWSQSHFLKHLFKRIFAIPQKRFQEFYQHHLDYYLQNVSGSNEEQFFRNFWEIIERQLKVLNSKDVYADNHVKTQRELEHLKKFMGVLVSFDKWNYHKLNDGVIAKQESEIYALRLQIEELKIALKKATSLDTKQYIDIPKGGFLIFLDLLTQIQDLKLDSGKELVFAEFPIVWVKLICKYFREDHSEIDFDRVRRYFPKDRRNPANRSSSIPSDQHHFEIKEVKRKR